MNMDAIYAWSLQSPDSTVWVPSITTEGMLSFVSGGGIITATPPVFRGVGGTIWTPFISNAGLVSIVQGNEMGQRWAWKIDINLVRWYFDVDATGIVTIEGIVSFEERDDGIMLKNRVRETSVTSGTGTLSLSGAVAGFRSFVAGFGTGVSCYYVIIDGTGWEVGIGTVTSGVPDVLARNTVLDSSASGAKLSLSGGVKFVFNDAPSSYFKRLEGLSLICSSGG